VKKPPSVPIQALGVPPLPETEPSVAPEVILRETTDFVRDWLVRRQGSPAELVRGVEEQVGWRARHVLMQVLAALRKRRDLPTTERKFLNYSLSEGAVTEALAGEVKPNAEHQSSLDELFTRSRRYGRTKKFAEAVEFISKFREYSPFNNMLVFLQNPHVTYFATASHWHKAFRRTIKEEARGLVILAPRTPVLIVYNIDDTEGSPLPGKLENFTQTFGPFNPLILDHTVKNCERGGILVERKTMGVLRGGFATARVKEPGWKMRIGLRQQLEPAAAYAVLCHELAHIFLGHVGANKEAGWPYRLNLPHAVMEIEAEAVAHIVCRRAGLRTHAAEYLAGFVEDDDNLEAVSIDLVSRVAARIEEMGSKLLK
jgi:hypothetical protein